MLHLMIKPGQLSLKQLRQVSRSPVVLSLDPEAIPAIAESAQVVEQVISEGRTVYGINTGFGLLANTKLPRKIWKRCKRASCFLMLRASVS